MIGLYLQLYYPNNDISNIKRCLTSFCPKDRVSSWETHHFYGLVLPVSLAGIMNHFVLNKEWRNEEEIGKLIPSLQLTHLFPMQPFSTPW